MDYPKIMHNFAVKKHKVIEEYLKLSYPENIYWIFLERHPQSFALTSLNSKLTKHILRT